ncbi:MAG: hypothetical protein ACYDDS_19780 [Candidatus Sulfotelmatobacter sp.]
MATAATTKQIERTPSRKRWQEVKIVVDPNTGAWSLKQQTLHAGEKHHEHR